MDKADIERRFDYHPPVTDEARKAHEAIRSACKDVAEFLNCVLPEGREKSVAITHLEDTMMWANAAIARNGGPA